MKDDLDPAALPPRLHELAGCEPRPCGGIIARVALLVLRLLLGRLWGRQHRIPHDVHSRARGQHPADWRIRVRGHRAGPLAVVEAQDDAVVVTATQLPPDSSTRLSHPWTKSARSCGALVRGVRGAGPAAADGEGTQVLEGRPHGDNPIRQRAVAPVEAGGPPKPGCRALPPVEGLVERGPGHCRALGDPLQRRQPPTGIPPRSRSMEHPMPMSCTLRWLRGAIPGGVPRACHTPHGLFAAREAEGQQLADIGEPQAVGGRMAAPRRPAACPLFPGALAVARNQLQPVAAHPVRGRRPGAR